MANIEKGSKQISEGLKKSTDILTNLFDSIKKIVPDSGYSVSKPVKSGETVEIRAGEKSVKSSGSFVEKIMNRKVLVPVLVIAGIYFGLKKLTK